MRREQVLKICANHYINSDMKLKPNATSDKSYVWHAYDYADEMPKSEQLAIRFKTVDEASLFKKKFEEAQNILATAEASSTHSKQKPEEGPTKANASKTAPISSFGSQFHFKEGEWQCSVCLAKNIATSVVCVCCQNPNPSKSSKSVQDTKLNSGPTQSSISASTFSFTKDTLTNKIPFGEPFIKENEPWHCTSCSRKYDASTKQCNACQNPDQSSVKKTEGFGSAFSKKAGQWDCSICLVRNAPSATLCVSCQSPNSACNTQATVPSASSFSFSAPSSAPQKDLGVLFAKTEGQWDCDTCCVRNEASAQKCVSCSSPKTQATVISTAPSVVTSSGFKFGTNAVVGKPPGSALEAMFARKTSQWDCTMCLVRNEDSAASCVACQTPNPNAKPSTSSTSTKTDFIFGIKSNSSEPSGQIASEFKCDFSGKDFKFGTNEGKSFKAPVTNEETKTAKGFSFVMPASATTFKFGIPDSSTSDLKPKETSSGFNSSAFGQVKMPVVSAETDADSEKNKQKQSGDVPIGPSGSSSSFADVAKASTAEGFAFNKDPLFKGFSRAGEKLFVPNDDKNDQPIIAVENETSDELYKTDDRDDIHFEPIVNLPDKVELVTGEEDEKLLYSQRVKLFRFDADVGQWKERGVGLLKILKNDVNGKLRMLMRREQVFKVCANHWITTTMNLKPLSGSDRAWMWMANDVSDGDAKLEQLAAKFKTPEQAEDFKSKFEECQRLLLDIPLQTPHKLVDTGTAHMIQKAEKMKSGLKDLKTFLTDKNKPLDEEDITVNRSTGLVKDPPIEGTEATFEWDTYDMRGHSLEGNLDDSVYASPLEETPEKKNLFRFGESTAGFSFSFHPAQSPSKSPTKLNQSGVSVGTDDESDVTQEDERDGQYFEPVVPMPDLIEVTSGEENEQTLFCNRSKLYRFDKDANQWKERGIGDLKILQNYDSKVTRVVMRRDQVLKLCANHRITSDIHLQPMKGAERAWVWTALDFAEGEEKIELFAIRFKLQDVADLFKEVFEEAKEAQTKGTLLSPHSTPTPKPSPCGKAAVAILEETTRERTDQQKPDNIPESPPEATSSTPSEKSPKTVVSPPKFVFGSDVVKNIFGTENPKSFTFGNTATTASLFGFSFNASQTSDEETPDSKPAPGDLKVTSEVATLDESLSGEKTSQSNVQNPTVSSSMPGSSALKQPMPSRAKDDNAPARGSSPDVEVVFELTPTPEQLALSEQLMLPPTFFCYKNRPGYVSDDNDVDDEDFDNAVKKLNGQLYPESVTQKAAKKPGSSESSADANKNGATVPTDKAHADSTEPFSSLQSAANSNSDQDKVHCEVVHSTTEQVMEEKPEKEDLVSSTSEDKVGTTEVSQHENQEPDSTTAHTLEPVDLTSKSENLETETTGQGVSSIIFDFGLNLNSGMSFADLASNNAGDYAFGAKDKDFKWENTGATVFCSGTPNRTTESEDDCNEDVVHSEEIDFEPIVTLPEVEVKSGEEDEEVLFKDRAKLYRWDRDINQWKERGVGDIKILFHQEKNYYRVLMRREQVLKVCANHVISKSITLGPLNTSNNALVWTATDYSDGEGRIEQLAARFKTQELADSFQRKFEECQNNLPDQLDTSS